MRRSRALLTAVLVVLVLLLVAAWLYYNQYGWTGFGYAGGQQVAFTASNGRAASMLRFKDCMFSTTSPSGQTRTADVTAILNGMAAAYGGDSGAPQYEGFVLGGSARHPLNPFSFTIKGFNDRATVSDPSQWRGGRTTLTGYIKTL